VTIDLRLLPTPVSANYTLPNARHILLNQTIYASSLSPRPFALHALRSHVRRHSQTRNDPPCRWCPSLAYSLHHLLQRHPFPSRRDWLLHHHHRCLTFTRTIQWNTANHTVGISGRSIPLNSSP
jgi:hypothetical protein